MTKFCVAVFGGLLLTGLSAPSFAQAGVLPDPTAQWYVGVPSGNETQASPGSGSYTITGGQPGQSATATASAAFGGSWASGSVTSNDSELQNSFSSEVDFRFEIVGPGYATRTHSLVSMTVFAQLSAQASGIDTGATAFFQILGPTTVTARADVGFSGEPPSDVVVIDSAYTFETNTVYGVNLTADGSTGPVGGLVSNCCQASASADPVFTLDPSLGPAYQLVVSPGVDVTGAVSPVPEPASACLMSVGIGAIALLMRRRSRMVGAA